MDKENNKKILSPGVMTDLHQHYCIGNGEFKADNLHRKAILIKKLEDWKHEDKKDEHEFWEVEVIFDISGRDVPYLTQTTLHPCFIGLCANPPDYDPKKDFYLNEMVLSEKQKIIKEQSCKLRIVHLPKLPKTYLARKKWIKKRLKVILALEISDNPNRYNHERAVILSDEQLEDVFSLFEIAGLLNKRVETYIRLTRAEKKHIIEYQLLYLTGTIDYRRTNVHKVTLDNFERFNYEDYENEIVSENAYNRCVGIIRKMLKDLNNSRTS